MMLQVVRRGPPDSKDRGYVLLSLLLTLSVLAIATAVVAPKIAFQIRRDREEEFIHRAVEYSRAVRRYVKSTGRYPLDLQDLNGKNGMRYIRKLYKDPITGRDFKLLYTRDILNATTSVPQIGQPVQGDGDNSAGDPNHGQNPTDAPAGPQNNYTGNSVLNSGSPQAQGATVAANSAMTLGSASTNQPSPGVFFGVVSTSKEKTIREFEHKNRYNQWLFFYDQNHETGFLVTGPTQLTLPTSQLGQPGAGAPSSALGQPGVVPQQPNPTPTN